MSEPNGRPPWVWDDLPEAEYRDRWSRLVGWVQWLEEAYEPWLVLPACWPAHEGLRTELILLWYWHGWLTTEESDPVAGLRWHAELRRAADVWRQLSTCDHRDPGPEHQRLMAGQRARRDGYVAQLIDARREHR